MMDIQSAKRLLGEGRFSEAEAAYRTLVSGPKQDPEALYGLGLLKFKENDFVAAGQWFVRSLEANPQGENSLYYLGEIATIRGDRDSAIGLFARVLTLNPRHVGALRRLTQVAGAVGAVAPAEGIRVVSQPRSPVSPAASPSPPQQVPNRPPRSPSSPTSTVGIAQHVKLQVVPFNGQAAAKQSLTFRVAVVDKNGAHLSFVGVEMRGFRIRGNVENGDWVEIGRIERSGKVKSFRNLSTGATVTTALW